MGVSRTKDMACVTGASFKFLVKCYRERDGNVRREEEASSRFLPSCAHILEISLRLKKNSPCLLKAGYKGQRNNHKT